MSLPVAQSMLKQLQWRYAVKRFDPELKIADDLWDILEQALVLTPSSFGLQPWRFVIVTDPTVKQQLVSASWNQSQPADCSHMVVMAIRKDMDEAFIDRHLNRSAELRRMPVEKLAGLKKSIVGALLRPGFELNEWAARQVYIALGNFMTAAALIGVDTCPMEGLIPAQYDEILNLPAQGYATCVGVAAGYRHAEDKYAAIPKVRFTHTDVIQRI